MSIQRILSGGQTGVDRAALDFAIARQIPHGGWCPAGRRAADGVLDARYQLMETESSGYRQRTKRNVLDADATLIIYRDRIEGGSLLTRDLATGHGKPLLLCDLHDPAEELLAAWQDWLLSQRAHYWSFFGARNMSRSDARCATPYIYSGELQIRPEVDAALAALKDKPYTAIPSWKNDGTWELWTVEGDGETKPCIISGPSTTYPSEADALAAGAAWLSGQR
ncbi:putative molybdenum carrier protein [Burkholderia multivorans]|nr:putative molybdenum carrier protein [Burkholderia multivorans]MDN7598022.1 putative molybdenum carrier protein [Burkholderia multivorans]